jgi:UDP-N-acetyl-D-galactosamine dehydrogenase
VIVDKNDLEPVVVVGLGYVGLPLVLASSKKFKTIGFDVNKTRIQELKNGFDKNHEYSEEDINGTNILYTSEKKDLRNCKTFIITLPTPLGENLQPDISILKSGVKLISEYVTIGSLIIFESTVFPGCTENICIPLIEKITNLKASRDFYVAYSPERINPGDKIHNFYNINKVVSGIDNYSIDKAHTFYKSIIDAEIFTAKNIKVAEMSKVLENTQRDVNVALMNEISIICNKLNISVFDVLSASETKWNFLKFTPGIVGGHCIGVDPYYLAHSALSVNYNPDIILTSRRINESYIDFLLSIVVNKILTCKLIPDNILILGGTFKENCSDIRNSKALEFASKLDKLGYNISIMDSHITELPSDLKNFKLVKNFSNEIKYDLIISLVRHDDLLKISFQDYFYLLKSEGLFFDFKNFFSNQNSIRLIKL